MGEKITQEVKELVERVASDLDLEVVSIRYYHDESQGDILEILLDHDYDINLDEITQYTEKISPLLDEFEQLSDYTLDVASAGPEKEIPFEDLSKLLDRWLDVKVKDKAKELMCLEAVEEGKAKFFYFIKGRKKKVALAKDDVESIRMGYKA